MVKVTSREQTRRTEYDRIREKPFTRIHGKPSRTDYDLLVEETKKTAVTVQIPAYDSWADKYRLLAEVIGPTEYLAKNQQNICGTSQTGQLRPRNCPPTLRPHKIAQTGQIGSQERNPMQSSRALDKQSTKHL